MKNMKRWLKLFGFNISMLLSTLKGFSWYFRDLHKFKAQRSDTDFPFGTWYPILKDKEAASGTASGHYFYQDLHVAQRIFKNNPTLHVDIGSRVDGFVSHVASFRSIKVFDIRPLKSRIKNVEFIQADFMNEIGSKFLSYCDSLSCLHVIEHFGLGRYGDPLNYYGHPTGMDNLAKVLKKGGKLYLSVPIGPQRIEFNAHRVFSVNYLLKYFEGKFIIDHFSYVDDKGMLNENVELNKTNIANNFNCHYGAGIFELTKR